MPSKEKLCIVGRRILINGSLCPATVTVKDGKIVQIYMGVTDPSQVCDYEKVINCGDLVVMPGIIDSHVHINEPGRTEWEGFFTATKAAAAGGVTTLIDMPLNSIPPTTTTENLLTKQQAAAGKCHVDIGFWGGFVPDNHNMLLPLVDDGVIGFKCFLTDSGVDEFPSVTMEDVDEALTLLKGTGSLLAFHAEVDVSTSSPVSNGHDKNGIMDPEEYQTFLNSRPSRMEEDAIELVAKLCRKHGNVRCHIVHLSSAKALKIIAKLKADGFPLTVETCPHYLVLNSEEIQDKETTYKCCPPIRELENQDLLWQGLRDGLIDMIVSDHSPCTSELKEPGVKDFMSAWGGISSVQFGLSLIWTAGKERNFDVAKISQLMSQNPAKLAGIGKTKGQIRQGFDADFVIWDPEAKITVEESGIFHKNKLTPYTGKVLRGKVVTTILRGHVIYNDGHFSSPMGEFVVPNALEEKVLKDIITQDLIINKNPMGFKNILGLRHHQATNLTI